MAVGATVVVKLLINVPANNISLMSRLCLRICRFFTRSEINDAQVLHPTEEAPGSPSISRTPTGGAGRLRSLLSMFFLPLL